MKVHVKVGRQTETIEVAYNATLSDLATLITQKLFNGDLSVSMTLLFNGRSFRFQRDANIVLPDAGMYMIGYVAC